MDWADAIQEFLDQKGVRWTEKTVVWYRNELNLLMNWCLNRKPHIPVEDLRSRHVLRFLAERQKNGVSNNTCRKFGWIACVFTRFWTREGLYKHDPLGEEFKMELPAAETVHVPCPKPSEVVALKRVIETRHAPKANPNYHNSKNFRSFMRNRDLAIVDLAAETGLRISEIIDLNDADIDLRARMITIRKSKSKSYRNIPITAHLCEALRIYRSIRNRQEVENLSAIEAFFFTIFGERMTRDGLHKHFDRYWKDVETVHGKPYTFHSFRHYAIKNLSRMGSLRAAKNVAGHSDIRTTDRYGALDEEETRADVERAATLSTIGFVREEERKIEPRKKKSKIH